jgi:hypothetical protein
MKKEENKISKKDIKRLKKAGINGAKAAKNFKESLKNLGLLKYTEVSMKKKIKKINYVKMIGKNCKWNKKRCLHCNSNEITSKPTRNYYYCSLIKKRCGWNTECNAFDEKGKLLFERRMS